MPEALKIPVLSNAIVRLEPLTRDHVAGLSDAARGVRGPRPFTTIPTPESAGEYVERSLDRAATGMYAPFAQIDQDSDIVVGHTAYLTPRWFPGEDGRLLALEIGSSWLALSARGTAINSASKLLLLAHAFETCQVERVDIKTDTRNEGARAAILAIGAHFEGVLRSWQPSMVEGETGRPRDTAMYSIVASEWPDVCAALMARIERKVAHPGDR